VLRPTVVNQNVVRPGTQAPVAPIVLVNGATNVTIANVTIDGSATKGGAALFPSCSGVPFYVGIYYLNSSGTIDTSHVTGIRSATECTFGVLAQSGEGHVAHVGLTNNLVNLYGVAGFNCMGQGTNCTVTGNAIRGQGPIREQQQSGIVIRAEAASAISGNVITDHFFVPARGVPQSSAGIFLFFADPKSNPHLLQNNVFANNQVDVQRFASAAAFD
jgi:hypothetical protein